jgi:hypothetical protein
VVENRASLRRIAGMPDSLAEPNEFELAVPILEQLDDSGCLVRKHFDEPLLRRLQDRASRSLVELFRNHSPRPVVWKFPKTGTGSSNPSLSATESVFLPPLSSSRNF